jgi:pescadillo protein
MKKIRKAKVRGDSMRVDKLIEATPSYNLHHLVKERYPTFTDAVRDLDDALSLVCLFAGCPSNKYLRISREMTQLSQTLWNEFDLWLKLSRSLRKSFLSVKGIYY